MAFGARMLRVSVRGLSCRTAEARGDSTGAVLGHLLWCRSWPCQCHRSCGLAWFCRFFGAPVSVTGAGGAGVAGTPQEDRGRPGPGEWESELNYTATIRKTPTPQAAGTQYFAMDVDEVPVAGSRPDRLTEVRPQERVSAAHRGAERRTCAWSTGSRCSCAADGLPGCGNRQVLRCPRSFLRTPSRSERCSGLRSWRNSWWKCPRTPVMLLQSWPCKPWGGGQHELCLSSSPPGQGGIQILAAATVAEAVVDVSVTTQLRSSRFSSSTWRCLSFSSSTEWWCSCFTETGTQCKLWRSPS